MNIQIFGTKKCNDTKKAQRFFKERGIKFQFIDILDKGMSKGEFQSVMQAVGGLDAMIDPEYKDKDLLALHEKRLRRILEVALSEGCDTIILGAFGCGAFQNNPEVVAQANRNVIKDYLHAFKNIEFAVYCSPRDDRNFKIFERVLKVYSR